MLALASSALLVLGCVGGRAPHEATSTPTVAAPLPANLTSFRYVLNVQASDLGGVSGATPVTLSVRGEVAAADRQRSASHLVLSFGAIDSERVQIGARLWTRDGTGPWFEEPAGTRASATRAVGIDLDPGVLVGGDAHGRLQRTLTGVASVPEQLGGVEVAKYSLAAAQVRVLLGVSESDSSGGVAGVADRWLLWVTKDRWLPVRLLSDSTSGGRVRLDLVLSEHNADVAIEAPK